MNLTLRWLAVLLMVVCSVVLIATAFHPAAVTAHRPVAGVTRGGTYLQTNRINVSETGSQANRVSQQGRLSADGVWAVFSTLATNLTPDEDGIAEDIFLREQATGVLTSISKSTLR